MLEYVPFLALLVAIVGLIQQQRVIHQQSQEIEELKQGRRKELIEKYYPPLAENLRLSLQDVTYRYIQGYQEHGHYFEILVDMANELTLKLIQGLDEELR